MAEKVYECMFILDSNKYARNPGSVSGQIPEMVEKLDGQVLASRLWNEQRLAYPIKGQRKGTYWLTYFRIDTDKLKQFNRACRLNDNILRNLTLRVDDRLVDALVSHALGDPTSPSAEEKESDTAAKPESKKAAAKESDTAAKPESDTAAKPESNEAAPKESDTAAESEPKAESE